MEGDPRNPSLPFDPDDTLELADFAEPDEPSEHDDEPSEHHDEPEEPVARTDDDEALPEEEPGSSTAPPEAAIAPASSETDIEPVTNDGADWHHGPSVFDDFTGGDYTAATTREYQGLAEAVRQSESEEHELQAVAATMPGIGAGLVGFEDVTGEAPTAPTEPAEKERSDLPARVLTGVVLLGLLFGSLWAGGAWFVALATLVAVISVGEFYAAVRRLGYAPVALFGLLGAIATMVSGWLSGPGGVAGAVAVFTMFILLWYSVLVRRHPLPNAAITIFGFVWIAGLLSFAAAIARSANALPLIIGLVFIAASIDVGSYFVGRTMGRRKLAPVVSPNKTVEGLIGGTLTAVLVALVVSLMPFFEPIDFSGALWLAVAVAVVSPLGDLAESMVKRSLGIKDMGSLLPGHGGLLDRIDGLLFAVPIGYFMFAWLEYL